MFRLQDNIPLVYINESRDFQLLSRIMDTLFSGVKYDIDSMVDAIDAIECRDSMLEILSTKVGFFPRIHIDSNVLKYIVSSFPLIIKNKGSKDGIEMAVYSVLKAENRYANNRIAINIVTKDNDDLTKSYRVDIYVNLTEYNRRALEEVLRYVVPAGFTYNIIMGMYSGDYHDNPDIYGLRDSMAGFVTLSTALGQVRISDDANAYNRPFGRTLNSYLTQSVITENNIAEDVPTTTKAIVDDGVTSVFTVDGEGAYNETIVVPSAKGKSSRRKK